MLETLITTLAVAAITGITIIAYRHPDGYKKIFPWLIGVMVVVMVIMMVWDLGVQQGYFAVSEFIEYEQYKDARAAINDKLLLYTEKSSFTKLLGIMVIMSYFGLLNLLPLITNTTKKKN